MEKSVQKVALVSNLLVSKEVSAVAAEAPVIKLPFVVIAIGLFHDTRSMDYIRKHLPFVNNLCAILLDPRKLSFPVHLRILESPNKMPFVSPLKNTEPFDLTLDKVASVNEHSLGGQPLLAAVTGDFVVNKRTAQL